MEKDTASSSNKNQRQLTNADFSRSAAQLCVRCKKVKTAAANAT